jgi:RNA polymerase sigma-70 factor (ECF subfamily)
MSADESCVNERKLVRKIQKHNDRKAVDELFSRYYKEIYAYVYKQCGERELAMDLTQDIFVAAFQGLHGFDERKSGFRTWLYHVAANKVTDYYRSKRHKFGLMQISIDEYDGEIADEYDVLKSLITKERVKNIMETVSGYDLVWVQIFQKKCFEDKTFAQISAELGISENTVKTRYYAIIKQLRKELAE